MAKVFQVDTGGTLTTGLVAYYKLEDANDFWGTNNLTNNGSVSFVAGKVNNAAQYSGSNYLSKSAPLITSKEPQSYAGWVYITSTNQLHILVENGGFTTHGGQGAGCTIYIGGYNLANGNDLRVIVWSTGQILLKTAVGTGWHHIAVVHNSDNTWIGYVDGVAGTPSSAYEIYNAPDSTDHFWLGHSDHSSNPYTVNGGKQDEWGVWNKALSATEISDLYNGGSGQTMVEQPLVSKIFIPIYDQSAYIHRTSLIARDQRNFIGRASLFANKMTNFIGKITATAFEILGSTAAAKIKAITKDIKVRFRVKQ